MAAVRPLRVSMLRTLLLFPPAVAAQSSVHASIFSPREYKNIVTIVEFTHTDVDVI